MNDTGPIPESQGAVVVRWKGGHAFDVGRPDRQLVPVDGSGKLGPSPFDTFLAAIGSCSAIDVVEILAKRKTPVRSLEVEVVPTRANGTPRRLVAATVRYRIEGEGIERVHAERAIDLALNKYCSVRSSIDPAIPVDWILELSP